MRICSREQEQEQEQELGRRAGVGQVHLFASEMVNTYSCQKRRRIRIRMGAIGSCDPCGGGGGYMIYIYHISPNPILLEDTGQLMDDKQSIFFLLSLFGFENKS